MCSRSSVGRRSMGARRRLGCGGWVALNLLETDSKATGEAVCDVLAEDVASLSRLLPREATGVRLSARDGACGVLNQDILGQNL